MEYCGRWNRRFSIKNRFLWNLFGACIIILKTNTMRPIILTLALSIGIGAYAQKFENGSFEKNSAGGSDQINLSNEKLNEMLPGVTAYGSYGDVDIIRSNDYGKGGPQDKKWYIAITGDGTDIVNLMLDQELVKGQKYTICFYDRKDPGYVANPIQLGLSTSDSEFGEVIHTFTAKPVEGVWTKRRCTFVAPNTGRYISVTMPGGDLQTWVNLDNFYFENAPCSDEIKLERRRFVIEKGTSVDLVASGPTEIRWVMEDSKDTLSGSSITIAPENSCVYKAISTNKGCYTESESVVILVTDPKSVEVVNKDTVEKVAAKSPVRYNRKHLRDRKIDIQEKMETKNAIINIEVFDKNKVDGDIVSVYLNGELVEEHIVVEKEKKVIKLHLQEGSNLLVLYAENMGKMPPNTAAVIIKDGEQIKLTTMVSDFKKNGAVELILNGSGLSIK